MKRKLPSRVVLPAAIFCTLNAFAQWSAWEQLPGGQFSVRTAQSDAKTCAVSIRNDTGSVLLDAKIQYVHDGVVDNDILPGLKPGEVKGGWTAFSFNGICGNARIRIYDAKWQ